MRIAQVQAMRDEQLAQLEEQVTHTQKKKIGAGRCQTFACARGSECVCTCLILRLSF